MPNYHIEGVYLEQGLANSYLEMIYAEDQCEAMEKAKAQTGESTRWLEGPRFINPDAPDYLERIKHPKLPGFD